MNPELLCPITLELMVEPILLPCCWKSCSRESIVEWLKQHNNCPLCRSDISIFDAINAPLIRNLANMIDELNSNTINVNVENNKINNENKFKAVIHRFNNNNPLSNTVVGKLEIICNNKDMNYKTLLVPVVDNSGSMSGNPEAQIRYILNRIIDETFYNQNLLTTVIRYSSSAVSNVIDTSYDKNIYKSRFAKQIGRGTDFR